MQNFRLLGIPFFILALAAPGYAAAQSIFVPAEGSLNSEVQQNQASAPTKQDYINHFVQLQIDLYRVVMTFDARAKQVEKAIRPFEEAELQRMEQQALAGKNAEPIPRTPEHAARYSLLVSEPTLCKELDESLKRYIEKNTPALEAVVKTFTAETLKMSENEKAETAARVRDTLQAYPDLRRAQEILYLCLYRYKNDAGIPRAYSVEKTMRVWFNIQLPLVDAWLGNVD